MAQTPLTSITTNRGAVLDLTSSALPQAGSLLPSGSGFVNCWWILHFRSRGPLRSSSQRWLFAFIGWVAAAALNLTLVYGVG